MSIYEKLFGVPEAAEFAEIAGATLSAPATSGTVVMTAGSGTAYLDLDTATSTVTLDFTTNTPAAGTKFKIVDRGNSATGQTFPNGGGLAFDVPVEGVAAGDVITQGFHAMELQWNGTAFEIVGAV